MGFKCSITKRVNEPTWGQFQKAHVYQKESGNGYACKRVMKAAGGGHEGSWGGGGGGGGAEGTGHAGSDAELQLDQRRQS